MLEKCANPACSAKFLRLHEGRLFVTEVEGADQSNGGHARQRQYFWLCSLCCRTMTVASKKEGGPKLFRYLSLQPPLGSVVTLLFRSS